MFSLFAFFIMTNYQIRAGFHPVTHDLIFSELAIREGTEMALSDPCHIHMVEEKKTPKTCTITALFIHHLNPQC